MAVTKRVLKPKVTVASVKRKWEEKYAELSIKYDALAEAHLDLARRADRHFEDATTLQKLLDSQNELSFGRLVAINELKGVVKYLESKLKEK